MTIPTDLRRQTEVGVVDARIEIDALVVGAGPAGCATALGLAARGWSVLLVERRRTDGAKTCGHCLSPRAIESLRKLGLEATVEAIAVGWHRRLEVGVGRHRLALPLRRAGLIVRRDRLDPLLRAKAQQSGVAIRTGWSLRSVEEPDLRGRRIAAVRTPTGTQCVRCALIVGADGLGSSVATACGLAADGRGARCRTRFAAANPTGIGISFDVGPDAPEWPDFASFPSETVRMSLGDGGYVGLVRESDGRLHGAAMLRGGNGAIDPRAELSALLGLSADAPAVRRLTLVGAAPLPWSPSARAAPGVALVGDAAGYAEPFTGEGMTWAFESAAILLAVIDQQAGGGKLPQRSFGTRSASVYCRQWRRVIGASHRRCARVGLLVRRPWLVAAAARIAPRVSAAIAAAAAQRVTADRTLAALPPMRVATP